jgi:hypothetical protein
MTMINGDVNGDGGVDLSDLGIMAANWGSTNAWWRKGDMNQDLNVDLTDLGILAGKWNATGLAGDAPAGGGSSISLAVPEPATLGLLSLGGLLLLRRRRR